MTPITGRPSVAEGAANILLDHGNPIGSCLCASMKSEERKTRVKTIGVGIRTRLWRRLCDISSPSASDTF